MPDTTAITVVSVSAGAVVALGGGILNAALARRQAERQFAHEREMADLSELRLFLERALVATEEVVECLLGISADLGDATDTWPQVTAILRSRRSGLLIRKRRNEASLTRRFNVRLVEQTQAIVELAEPVKQQLTGLMMRVGKEHALAMSFARLYGFLLEAVEAIPSDFPPERSEREILQRALDELGVAHGEFLGLAASYVGVDLDRRRAARVG